MGCDMVDRRAGSVSDVVRHVQRFHLGCAVAKLQLAEGVGIDKRNSGNARMVEMHIGTTCIMHRTTHDPANNNTQKAGNRCTRCARERG